MRDKRGIDKGIQQLCSLVVGQYSEVMMVRVSSQRAMASRDGIKLLKTIKLVCFNFHDECPDQLTRQRCNSTPSNRDTLIRWPNTTKNPEQCPSLEAVRRRARIGQRRVENCVQGSWDQ